MNGHLHNRAVITGVGVVAANGIGRDAFWDSLLAGRGGVGPVTLFDTDGLNCRIAGEVGDFEPRHYLPQGARSDRMARGSLLAIAAARLAMEDAGLPGRLPASFEPVTIISGVSTSAMDLIARKARAWTAVSSVPHSVVSAVACVLGLDCRLRTVSNGCASGLDAVASGADLIRQGAADLVLALASDSAITRYVFECFCSARKLSRRAVDPVRAGCPFDRERDGGVIAEGAGMVIIERHDCALARGAIPYAEFLGYGSHADSWDGAEGCGLIPSMQAALDNAGCRSSDIDAVSAHAPSDPDMDVTEVNCIKSVLGPHARRIPVTSIKGATGNPMGVGGMHQAIAAMLSLRTGCIPQTTNLVHPDPACDLDHVPGRPRRLRAERYLVNSHGFGRGNSAVVLGRVTDRGAP